MVAIADSGAVAGDLAGATHVLRRGDGLVGSADAAPAGLGVDLTRRYGAVTVAPAVPRRPGPP